MLIRSRFGALIKSIEITVGAIQKLRRNLIFLSPVKTNYVSSLNKDNDYKQNKGRNNIFDLNGQQFSAHFYNIIMIKLQVNHNNHTSLRSQIIHKEVSEITNETSEQASMRENNCNHHQLKKQQNKLIKNNKTDRESQVISSIISTTEKVKRDLAEMITQYKCEAEKMMINHGYDPQKEAQIRGHLKKLQLQKMQRKKKFQEDLLRLEMKKAKLDQSVHKGNIEIEQRRRSIEERIVKIQQRQKKRLQKQKQFSQFLKQYKKSKPKYQLMEEQFKKREAEINKDKQKKQIQKKQKYSKPVMNIEQIAQFQQNYLNNKNEAEKIRLQNKFYQRKKEQAEAQKLNELYKGHCHTNIMRQLQQKVNKSKEAHEKYQRIKEYSEIVKQEYKPKTVRSSLDEELQESESSNAHPQTERGKRKIKERFLNGQYIGKKVQFEAIPLSQNEQIRKGIEYLQFLKKLPKKPKKQITQLSTITPSSESRKKIISGVYRVQRQRNPLYKGKRYNSIDFNNFDDRSSVNRVVDFMKYRNSQLQLEEKLLKNRGYQNRQNFMEHQKQFNNNLVANIQQKLSILKRL